MNLINFIKNIFKKNEIDTNKKYLTRKENRIVIKIPKIRLKSTNISDGYIIKYLEILCPNCNKTYYISENELIYNKLYGICKCCGFKHNINNEYAYLVNNNYKLYNIDLNCQNCDNNFTVSENILIKNNYYCTCSACNFMDNIKEEYIELCSKVIDNNKNKNEYIPEHQNYKIFNTACPNCGYKKDIQYNSLIITCKCDVCLCEWVPTWRELGINADDLRINILNNPNPKNINFGIIKKENSTQEMFSISGIYDIIKKYIINQEDKAIIDILIKQCIISENNFKGAGYEPSPRKYIVIADKARNAAAFEVENFIYKYLLQFFELHKINIKDNFGYYGSIIKHKEITDKFNNSISNDIKKYRPSNIETIDINKNKKTKLVDQCLKNGIDIEIFEIECDEYRKVFLDNELNYYSSESRFIQKNILKNYDNVILYGIESLSLIIKAYILEYLENISKDIVNNIPIEGLCNYDSIIETNIEDGRINVSAYESKKEDFIGRKLIDQINMYDFDINNAIEYIYKVDNDLLLKNLNIIHNNDIIKQLYPYSDPNILYNFAKNLDKNIIVEIIKYINDNKICISSFPSIIYQDEKNSLHGIFIKGNRRSLSEQEINIINVILNKFLIHSKVIRVKTKLTSLLIK